MSVRFAALLTEEMTENERMWNKWMVMKNKLKTPICINFQQFEGNQITKSKSFPRLTIFLK